MYGDAGIEVSKRPHLILKRDSQVKESFYVLKTSLPRLFDSNIV